MNHRTSRVWIVLKIWLPCCIIFDGWLFLIAPGYALNILVGSLIGAFGLCYGIDLIVRIFGAIAFGNDPNYQLFIKNGGSPFFDMHLPYWINPDCYAVRMGGIPEPCTQFVPPLDWLAQCNSCGARNEALHGACWNCGNDLSAVQQAVPQASGRLFNCFHCGRSVQEITLGDLDRTGVICPFCNGNTVSTK